MNDHTSPVNVLTATAADLSALLASGQITSYDLVDRYLEQIERHDKKGLKLNAMISLAPLESLHRQAKELDSERALGKIRGPLHGIPIIVKDNIMTETSLGMDTTCGSFAFKGIKVKSNAKIINDVLDSGMIILGKTNLSEWAGKKGYDEIAGWSAVGGQTQSPYVRGGVVETDQWLGHSTPCGSSSGSAAGVAAGYAPLSLATEIDGSTTQPAGRASLYGLKFTIGSVSTNGTSPCSPLGDGIGCMGKSSMDIALLAGVLLHKDLTACATPKWNGQRLGFVDPDLWELDPAAANPECELLKDTRFRVRQAADLAEQGGAKVVRKVHIPQAVDLRINGRDIEDIWDHDFASAMTDFLKGYEDSPVTSIRDLVDFNNRHADKELPKGPEGSQGQLLAALENHMDDKFYEEGKAFLKRVAKTEGLDRAFTTHDIDVLLGPLDGRIVTIAAAAGYPVGVVPLGYADYLNGRAFGMVVVAAAEREDQILKFMSAWEAANPDLRKPPPQLL